jgi:hypothetical protein
MSDKMMINGTILKWGNSYGIRINKELVDKLNLKEKDAVIIDAITPSNPLQELWGLGKTNPISKKEFQKARKEIESKWMK